MRRFLLISLSFWLAASPLLAETPNRQFYANVGFGVSPLFSVGSERKLDEHIKKIILRANHAAYGSSRPGSVEKGIEILSSALKNTSPKVPLLLERASLYVEIELDNRATKDLMRVLQIDPENKFAHYGLGTIYLKQDRHAESISALEIAIQRMPESILLVRTMTYALVEVGRFEDAIVTARQAAVYWREDDFNRGGPWHRDAEGLLADVYCLAGQADKSIEVYQAMGELSPAYWKEKAEVIARTDRVKKSSKQFKTPPDVVMRRWIKNGCPGLLTEEKCNVEEKT